MRQVFSASARLAAIGAARQCSAPMENGTTNLAQAEIGDASQEHPVKLAKQVTRENFETLVTMLGASSHADIVQLFVGRVPYFTVIDWRRGKATIPRWALGYLATLCRQRASVFLMGAEIGDKTPVAPTGRGSHRNITKWNEQRAREQINLGRRIMKLPLEPANSEKEKAG